uniref:TonB-dependent receptor n=1 Tax=Roseihalotalea indica TaxID=2867963 RepID=A0AA49GRB1_9BACT|nr:TonB-dependent receptor [Tunicatimonas sp. TK19036]
MNHSLQPWLLIFLFLIFTIQGVAQDQFLVSAHTGPPDRPSPPQEEQSLKQVLDEIKQEYQVTFGYPDELIRAKTVNAPFESREKNLEQILHSILDPLGLDFKKLDPLHYVIKAKQDNIPPLKKIDARKSNSLSRDSHSHNRRVFSASQQMQSALHQTIIEKNISGQVTDEAGEGLPGVNILAKGTTQGTVTDIDGNYQLTVKDNVNILIFSSIGYLTREIPINGQTTLNLTLTADVQSLSEVVVVGYGTQKKADVTGSVANVSEEVLQSRPVASFEDALQGRTSGVQIRQAGGNLNGKFSISIRGVGSVTGSNDPLIVVDGVPLYSADFSTINPKDIASIDILKDASATAIYGSRAANGVVIVSTKKGKAGTTQFTFNTDLGFEEITNRFDVMSTEQQRLLFVEAFKNSNRDISVYDDPSNPAWQVDTDWQELGTRTGFRQNYNLGFSGGSEQTQFSGSASYLNREGTLLNSDLKTWSLRVNVTSKLNDWLKLSTNLSGSHQLQNLQNNDSWGSSGFRSFVYQHSFTPAYDDNGNLTAVNTTAAPYFGANDNPLIDVLLPTRRDQVTRILGNTKLDVTLTDDLVLSGNLGGDVVLGEGYNYFPVYEIGRFSQPEGRVVVPNSQQINWVSDITLNYDKTFNQHSIKALAGFSAQQFLTKNSTTTGMGTVDNALNQLSNQTSFDANGSQISAGLVSTFLRLNYGYQDKYLLTATVRRDGSSKFGPDKRYGVFPSGSVAWRVSEEGFLQSSQFIDDLKFRVSYGLTGNQNIGDFAFITRAGAAPYVFGNSVVVGNAPQNIGNPDLQWEATKQFDIGADISILEGRIYATLDYYDKQSEDLLVSTPIPLTSGVGQDPIVNLGSVKNTGVEFSFFSRNITGNVSWTTDFNISYNKNEVINIGTNSIGEPLEIPGELIPLSNQQANLTRAGHPVGAFYMYQYAGVWQLGEEDEALEWSGAVPGDPRYADLNGNGVLDIGDKTFVGTPTPKFFGGMENTVSYKNLSLSLFLNFATGYQVYNTARNLFSRGVPFVQNFAEVADFWTPENPSNTVPRPSQGGNTTTLTTLVSTRFLEDADFLRVKNVRLSYTFPASMFNGNIVRGAQLTLSGTNLFTFTNYTGLDPEASSRASLLSAGIDYTPYPNTRLVSLGARVTF